MLSLPNPEFLVLKIPDNVQIYLNSMLSLPNPEILVLKIPDIVQIYLNSILSLWNPEILVLKIPDIVQISLNSMLQQHLCFINTRHFLNVVWYEGSDVLKLGVLRHQGHRIHRWSVLVISYGILTPRIEWVWLRRRYVDNIMKLFMFN